MTDAIISLAAKAAEYLVKPTIQLGRYLFCASLIVQNLAKEKELLSDKIEEIQKHIQEEKKKTKRIEESVKKSVTEAENVLKAAENLIQEMEAIKKCFQGWCPPWRRYRLSKQMEKKTEEMREQRSKIKIEPFPRLMSLSNIDHDCSEGFTDFPSRRVAYKEILEALQDGNTKIIGLYGMGGSGKTALVNEVMKEAEKLPQFGEVILVTVSRTPNIKTIQEQMAKRLKLKLEEEDEEERAKRLWLCLKEHNRVLIILDDLWSEFNLKLVGINFDKNHEGSCKILLTARTQEVGASMDREKRIIVLDPLLEEEAWSLFQKFAGIDDQSSHMVLDLAHKVSERCKGLPIAIKVMASSLKTTPREFHADQLKVALETLKGSKPEKEGDMGEIFNCLEFSYDYLKREEAKHLLCMCAMFPEDYEIPMEDLIRYGIGLGVCGESKSFEFARSRIRLGLGELLGSFLLMYTDGRKKHVKMHDLIHEMALLISQKKDRTIKVNHEKDLNSLAGDKDLKQCFAISTWGNEINRLSSQLDAPNLEVLLVNTRGSLDLSSLSFEFMKKLKVMAIINNVYLGRSISLPQSIQSMTNLKTLRLTGWQLDDISFVLSLEGLEVLDLQWCIFNEVPDEIEKLQNLKLLDLRNTAVKNYNSKAIGKCSELEEFYVSASWDSDYKYKCPPPPQSFVQDVTPVSLLRYELKLGGRLENMGNLEEMDSITRVLGLQVFDVSTLDGSEENFLRKAEYVRFNGLCGGSKNIVPDVDLAVGCMDELNRLDLVSCSEIECLFVATSNHGGSFPGDALLPCRLITLRLEGMENLTEVCRGEPPLDFFKKLEELYISRCPQLHNIFPRQCSLGNLKILSIGGSGTNCRVVVLFSMFAAKNMRQLEELTIDGCPELRHVIINDAEDGANASEEISLAPNDSHLLFPNLKKLRISRCPKLQVIFSISSAQQNEIQMVLPHLQVFELRDLENLLEVLPQNYASRWPSVKTLEWRNCPKLTTSWIGLELRQQDVISGEDHQKPLTLEFQTLILTDLPESMMIWFGLNATQILSFQFLQDLQIIGFKEMKFIFSMAVLRSLSKLTSLYIENCNELVEIIAENEESKNFAPDEVFFPKLSYLTINGCNKLKSLFSITMIRILPQLSTLHVRYDTQLMEIFGQSSEANIGNETEIVVPNLKEIILEKLPNFVNIYQGFIMHKVELKDVTVNRCPKFIPVLGATHAIPLHHRTEEKLIVWPVALTMNQLCRQQMWPIALKAFLSIEEFGLRNSGVEGILQLQLVEEGLGRLQQSNNVAQKHLNSNLIELYLCKLTELRFIWSGPTQFLEFRKLTSIIVNGCPKLKIVFPSCIVGSLQNLQKITICNCEELEEISELQVECFPKINNVNVRKCNKLKCIFYADCMASRHYAIKRSLWVRKCSQLERIYGLKCTIEANNEDHGEQEVLLELADLVLESLPNFTEIGHGIKLKNRPWRSYQVKKCPKYIQQFAGIHTFKL